MAESKRGARQRRLRLQIRVVQTVFRAEMQRLERAGISADREDRVRDLRSRSIAILEAVRAELDASAGWDPEVSALIREVEAELGAGGNDGGL